MARSRERWFGYRVLERGRTECATTGDQTWVDQRAAYIANEIRKPVMVIEHFGTFFKKTGEPQVVSIWTPPRCRHKQFTTPPKDQP